MDATTREAFLTELQGIAGKKHVKENAPMSQYTTLRVGGPAELFCDLCQMDALPRVLAAATKRDVPIALMGNGSNLLVKDGGIRGLVLRLGEEVNAISPPMALPDGRVALTAEAGALLHKLAQAAASYSLTGLEFAAGIPGTVGGAATMNAGAYGGEMKDVVTTVLAYDFSGKPLELSGEALQFGYRSSRFSWQGDLAVAKVTFALQKGEAETIRTTMREFMARRKEKQPLSLPSCGSTFKRPEGQFAGTLIEQCGLKGYRIGGASVSQLHAGFLVNDQEGTAADYLALVAHVQQVVLEKTGVRLEPEVRILGEDAPVTLV